MRLNLGSLYPIAKHDTPSQYLALARAYLYETRGQERRFTLYSIDYFSVHCRLAAEPSGDPWQREKVNFQVRMGGRRARRIREAVISCCRLVPFDTVRRKFSSVSASMAVAYIRFAARIFGPITLAW
jgi:hypothetical protein